jgi:hypothetical protein
MLDRGQAISNQQSAISHQLYCCGDSLELRKENLRVLSLIQLGKR